MAVVQPNTKPTDLSTVSRSPRVEPRGDQPAVAKPKAEPVVQAAKSGKQPASRAVDKASGDVQPAKRGEPLVTEVNAKARFIRVAPRKVRLVINQLKGRPVVEALGYLQFVRRSAVRPVAKLLQSAVANAEHNFRIDRSDLFIKQFTADDGPTLKRYRPRAHGRSAPIAKRTSHLKVVLGVKPGARQKAATPAKQAAEPKPAEAEKKSEKSGIRIVSPDAVKKEAPKVTGRGPAERGKTGKGFLKRIFQRRTG